MGGMKTKTYTYKDAQIQGEQLFKSRCKMRTNNTRAKCLKASLQRKVKNGMTGRHYMKRRVDGRFAFYWEVESEYKTALKMVHKIFKPDSMNAYDFCVIFWFFKHYMGVSGNSLTHYKKRVANIKKYGNYDLRMSKITNGEWVKWNTHVDIVQYHKDGFYTTRRILQKTKRRIDYEVKCEHEQKVFWSIVNSADAMQRFVDFDDSRIKPYTIIEFCEWCGKAGDEKETIYYDGLWSPDRLGNKRVSKKATGSVCCPSCLEKARSFSDGQTDAIEMRLNLNKATKALNKRVKL